MSRTARMILGVFLLSATACNKMPAPFEVKDRSPRAENDAPFDPPNLYPGWAYDSPGYMRPAEELTPEPRAKRGDPLHYFTNKPLVMIRQPAGYTPEEIPRVAIWWTDNNGFLWRKAGYFGRQQKFFPFEVEEDGDYGIRFVGPGQPPAIQAPAYPERVLHVDTVAPKIEVSIEPEQSLYEVGQAITISWRADDYHLIDYPASVSLLMDFTSDEPRSIELQRGLAAEGSMTYEIPPEVSNHEIRFRIEAPDRAGNLGMIYSYALQVAETQLAETGDAAAPASDAAETPAEIARADAVETSITETETDPPQPAAEDRPADVLADAGETEMAEQITESVATDAQPTEPLDPEDDFVGPVRPERLALGPVQGEDPTRDERTVQEFAVATGGEQAVTIDTNDAMPEPVRAVDQIPAMTMALQMYEDVTGDLDPDEGEPIAQDEDDAAKAVAVHDIEPAPILITVETPAAYEEQAEAISMSDQPTALPFPSAIARLPGEAGRLAWEGPKADAFPSGHASDVRRSTSTLFDAEDAPPAGPPDDVSSHQPDPEPEIGQYTEFGDAEPPPDALDAPHPFESNENDEVSEAPREDDRVERRELPRLAPHSVAAVDPTRGNGLSVPLPATVEPDMKTHAVTTAHPWRVLGDLLRSPAQTVWSLPRTRYSREWDRAFNGRFLADHPALRPVAEPGEVSSAVAGLPAEVVEADPAVLP